MDQIAKKRGMLASVLIDAHRVRDAVVHRDGPATFDFATCARALTTYLAWLPPKW